MQEYEEDENSSFSDYMSDVKQHIFDEEKREGPPEKGIRWGRTSVQHYLHSSTPSSKSYARRIPRPPDETFSVMGLTNEQLESFRRTKRSKKELRRRRKLDVSKEASVVGVCSYVYVCLLN